MPGRSVERATEPPHSEPVDGRWTRDAAKMDEAKSATSRAIGTSAMSLRGPSVRWPDHPDNWEIIGSIDWYDKMRLYDDRHCVFK